MAKAPLTLLYSRLKDAGFDREYLRAAVLPEWWDDTQAKAASSVAVAELAVARQLGFTIEQLRSGSPLKIAPTVDVRLKRNKDVTLEQIQSGIAVAKRVAQVSANACKLSPYNPSHTTPDEVRAAILQKRNRVDLDGIVEYCWSQGIIVVHLAMFPGGKKFDGVALFAGDRPVIVLCSGKDSPAWLAFHIAHELGHILLNHVKPGTAIAEVNFKTGDKDPLEIEADSFACSLLVDGKASMLREAPTPAALMLLAKRIASLAATSPGIVALFYAKNFSAWPMAQYLIKQHREDSGAHTLIQAYFTMRSDLSLLPDSQRRFLTPVL